MVDFFAWKCKTKSRLPSGQSNNFRWGAAAGAGGGAGPAAGAQQAGGRAHADGRDVPVASGLTIAGRGKWRRKS